MKNCGTPFHDEVATKEFMDELRTLIKVGISGTVFGRHFLTRRKFP